MVKTTTQKHEKNPENTFGYPARIRGNHQQRHAEVRLSVGKRITLSLAKKVRAKCPWCPCEEPDCSWMMIMNNE